MYKHKHRGMIGMIRKDGMTGLLNKQEMRNALNLKVVRGRRTFPTRNQGYGFEKEAHKLRTKKKVFY